MKKFICIVISFSVFSLCYGFYCKSTFQNNGVADLRTVEDVMKLDCNMYVALDEEALENYTSENVEKLIDNLDASPIILIVLPTNNIRQYETQCIQEVTVVKSIRGDVLENEKIFITHSGGPGTYSIPRALPDPLFDDFINLLHAPNKYLIFLEENPLNKYTKDQYFEKIGDVSFSCLNISSDYSISIDKPIETLKLSDFGYSEYFTSNQNVLSRVLEIKHKILAQYDCE